MQFFLETYFKSLTVVIFLFANQLARTNARNIVLKNISNGHPSLVSTDDLHVESTFKFPAPLPNMPSDESKFGKGTIDLGGLEVIQVTISNSTARRVWRTYEGGGASRGHSIFEPINLPSKFSKLGFCAQPNNRQLFGWVLAARDISGNSLRPAVDYVEVGNTTSLNIKQDGAACFWQPLCPRGYHAVGLFVNTCHQKPPLGKEYISCVRSDFTEQSESDSWVWRTKGVTVSSLRPANRGTPARGVYTGTFSFRQQNFPSPSLLCLKNTKFDMSTMPTQDQTRALFQAYSPRIYLHPDEDFLPSSLDWFFGNGALLYQKGNESNPVPVQPNGSNLPQGGSDDGLFWLDYPVDKDAKEKVKRGDLGSTKVYLHIKPVFGGTFTDIVVWIFYPFNGNARLKFLFIESMSLGYIGEHIGDWEHVTLRISNFNGELWRVYFSEHGGGTLVDACDLEFEGGNKPVIYSSLHSHAMFSKPGLVLQGKRKSGIRNDMARSDKLVDCGVGYEVIAGHGVVEPPWVNYVRKWGPRVSYNTGKLLNSIANILPEFIRKRFQKLIKKIPVELLGEDGPTGPKVKVTWTKDEKY